MIPPPLVAITPGDHGRGRALERWLEALGEAGLEGVILREPHLDSAELRGLVEVAQSHVGWVVVHARNPHAEEMGLPVHLTSSGLPPRGRTWGRSCHTAAEVDGALGCGASWATWSPVWRPSSKPADARSPIGLTTFLSCAAERPVLALGGVTPRRLAALEEGGGWGAAVLGGLFGHSDPQSAAAACARYLAVGSKGNRSSKPS